MVLRLLIDYTENKLMWVINFIQLPMYLASYQLITLSLSLFSFSSLLFLSLSFTLSAFNLQNRKKLFSVITYILKAQKGFSHQWLNPKSAKSFSQWCTLKPKKVFLSNEIILKVQRVFHSDYILKAQKVIMRDVS